MMDNLGVCGFLRARTMGFRTWRGVIAFIVVLVLPACVTDPPPPGQVAWETTLTGGIDHPEADGSAAAVSSGSSTQASIAMTGLDPGEYSWGIFRGECADGGGILGAPEVYPVMTAAAEGDVTTDALIGHPMPREDRFFAEMRAADGALVACGDFVLWQ